MSERTHNRLDAKGFLNVAIIISALVLASSLVLFVERPTRASSFVPVDISSRSPTLFDPQGVTINVGDSVLWLDVHEAHTTTSDPDQAEYWHSAELNDGATFSHTFTHTGNFTYYSTFPEDVGQIGWVYVQQPVPEFPGYTLYIAVAAGVVLALLVERRLRA